MFNKFLKRIKSQKGISGVLVALLLVMVGLGLVAGINTYMSDAKEQMLVKSDASLIEAGLVAADHGN